MRLNCVDAQYWTFKMTPNKNNVEGNIIIFSVPRSDPNGDALLVK